jgi:ribosome assembly protein YihI (activator of Der GTPase)
VAAERAAEEAAAARRVEAARLKAEREAQEREAKEARKRKGKGDVLGRREKEHVDWVTNLVNQPHDPELNSRKF